MAAVARRRATYADLEAVPAHLVAEILDGESVTHPRPLPRQGTAHASLMGGLVGAFQRGRGGPGGWIFITEPELHLGEHVIVPDIAAWRRKRMTALPETVGTTLPPDWICEVLSPSTASYDRTVIFRIYHEHRAAHLWHLDPVPIANFAGFEEVRAPPFDAITIPLGDLWPFDAKPEPQP